MLGASFLIHHGQDYSHLDLRNSYGQYINSYYNASYPSGADTLFGGSALLSGVPLIWAFQPFNAFMLATAAGPAWVLARQIGLRGALAALAALSITLPALVYGYELIASVKEITALAMILTLGALVTAHSRWLGGLCARRCAVRARGRRWRLRARGGVRRLGAHRGARARRDRYRPDHGEPSERTPAPPADRSWWGYRSNRRTQYMDRRFRVTEGGAEHRNDHQPGQPAKTAPNRADPRDVAGG